MKSTIVEIFDNQKTKTNHTCGDLIPEEDDQEDGQAQPKQGQGRQGRQSPRQEPRWGVAPQYEPQPSQGLGEGNILRVRLSTSICNFVKKKEQ